MKMRNGLSKLGMIAVMGAAMASGITALTSTPAVGKPPPRLDCGPTRQWICVLPGCPSCYEVLFEGTICEKAQYEAATGRKCSPAG